MLNYNVKIGLVPLRRDCTPRPGQFNWEIAEERGRKTVAYIKDHYTTDKISFVDLKGVIDVEVLWSCDDVDKVAEYFRKENVDSIVLIAANFGNEEAAGELAKKLGKPVLLWGPRDDAPDTDGMRYTDSQCGLFGISRQLTRMNVPFTYIKNCRVEDKAFAEGLSRFASVTCAVRNFAGMRIGQIGLRPRPFCSVICNEGQLMEEFDIHLVPINLAVVQNKFNIILKTRGEELKAGAEKLRKMYKLDAASEETSEKQYAYVLMFKDLFEEFKLDAISSECWSALQLLVGAMPCTAYGILADEGYIISCENDVHAAMTQVLLKSLSLGEKPPLFGEFTIRHPEDENVELLWHCGQFAYSVHREDKPCCCMNMRENFEAKAGHYTVARIDQDHGRYSIIAGECDSAEGPYTNGTYLWARFDNLDAWERKLIEGPYIHHVSEIEGSFTQNIKEVCKYVPSLNFDTV
ncbi:MAG: L-fucose/L-arabinose isomerase family protein [Monoglobaceae bacterium]